VNDFSAAAILKNDIAAVFYYEYVLTSA